MIRLQEDQSIDRSLTLTYGPYTDPYTDPHFTQEDQSINRRRLQEIEEYRRQGGLGLGLGLGLALRVRVRVRVRVRDIAP